MKYVVISPRNRLICFDHSDQVEEYCLEKDGEALDEYCEDQDYVYADLSSSEIGQMYVEVGADYGGCRIFETSKVIKLMKEEGVEEALIEQARDLFNDRRLHTEIDCPGFLEDFLREMTPITPAEMSDGIYFMRNIDSANDVRDRG